MNNRNNLNNIFKSIAVFACIVFALAATAQVNITVTIAPPYYAHFTDYSSHPQQVMIVVQNTGAVAENIQLRGSITGDNGVSVKVSQNYRSPSPLHLNPHEIRNLSGNDINALFDFNQLVYSGVSQTQLQAQGTLPEGNYQICARAYDYNSNAPLSEEQPVGCSNMFPVSSVEPPTIIKPADGGEVPSTTGQNFIITWSTPAGSTPSTQYTVSLVEILDNCTPQVAMATATPPFLYQTTVTGTNVLLYNNAMPTLSVGKTYALMVQARDPTNTVTFRNNGQSVITGFTYGAIQQIQPGESLPIITNNDSIFYLTGKIQWYFRENEETAPSGRSGPIGPSSELVNIPGKVAHPYNNSQAKVSLIAYYSQQPWIPNFPTNGGTLTQQQQDKLAEIRQEIEDEVWQGAGNTITTDANGNFQWAISVNEIKQLVAQNPRSSPYSKYGIVPDSLQITVQLQSDRLNLNGTWANDYGYATATIKYSTLINAGVYDMGNLTAFPRSYKFVPRVTDAAGNELTDATVNIYRRQDFYATNPIVAPEGNLNADQRTRQTVVIDGINYIKIASLPSGYTATRLFFTDGGSDNYKVIIQEGNYSDYNTSIAVRNPDETYDTYQQTFSMAMNPTVVAGHVHKIVNGAQLNATGAVIYFYDVFGDLYYGTSDSTGNFAISTPTIVNTTIFPYPVPPPPILPLPVYQHIWVSYDGQQVLDSFLLTHAGQRVEKEIGVNISTFDLSGTIVDSSGAPISSPLVHWASGGSYINVNSNGTFSTQIAVGTDTLIITKTGYADRRLPVTASPQGDMSIPVNPLATPHRAGAKPLLEYGTPGHETIANGNLGDIYLTRAYGRVNILVVDENDNPIQNATVQLSNGEVQLASAATDNAGHALIIGPSGALNITVYGSPNSNYVTGSAGIYAPCNGTTASTTIMLSQGIRITGTVTNNNSPVANAGVGLYEDDLFSTITQSNGAYSLVVPKGYNNLVVTKQGLQGASQQGTYNSDQVINFNLTKLSINITRLLGFNVEVDNIKDNGNTKLITGEFINLPSNNLFSVDKTLKLRFNSVAVTIQSDSIAIPVDDRIETDQSTINIKAFNYLPLQLQDANDDDDDVLIISKRDATGLHGQIKGNLLLNFSSIMPAGLQPYGPDGILLSNGSDNMPVVFTDDGSTTGNDLLYMMNYSNAAFNILNIPVSANTSATYIGADGIHFAGNVDLSSIPVLSGSQLTLSDVWIGTDGSIKNIKAQTPSVIKLANWSGQINGLSFNDNGLSLGGYVSLQLPGTGSSSNINFSNLQISNSQLYGGSFTLPSGGVDVFDVANITTTKPLTFGRDGSGNVYYISGAGTIGFTGVAASYLGDLTVNNFEFETNGAFAVNVAANISQSFLGIANLSVNKVEISDLNDNPEIDVSANIHLSIPDMSVTASNIHIKKSGVSVDDLALGFDIAGIASASVNLSFKNDNGYSGFSGSGGFDVPGFANLAVTMSYYKVPGGTQLSTSITAGTNIPLGTSGLFLTQVSGNFQSNTAQNTWQIGFGAYVSIGEGSLAGAQVGISIQNGPVIKGWANLQMAGIQLGTGNLTIDVPHSLFAVQFGGQVQIPGINESAGGNLVLSLDRSDKYFLLGTYANLNEFGLLKVTGGACVAWNFNISKHRNDNLSQYIACINPSVIQNGIFSGAAAYGSMKASLDNILPNFSFNLFLDFSIHSYCDLNAYGYVTAGEINNTTPVFAVDLGENWAFGAQVSIGILGVDWSAGLGVGFGARIQGYASVNPYRVNISATGSAFFQAALGDFTINPNVCVNGYDFGNWPNHDWISICFHGSLTIGFDTARGWPYFYAN